MAELDKLPWKPNRKGDGSNTYLANLPQPYRAVLAVGFQESPFKSLRLGDWNFTRFGDQMELLGRFPIKKEAPHK